ncbi:MAG TPA: type II toxin-antitoxin system ParD family antitoxin [Humisphaera sp.]|jgi:putative addiction module CopG family antidote|nr:type II toxin-antitoxin system ParD family antitoxin [Humisphaera sp.]
MKVSLRPSLQKFVESQVRNGRYANENAVVSEALRHLMEYQRASAVELRAEIAESLAELDRGEGTPWDAEEVKAMGRKLLAASRRKSMAKRKGA